MWFAITKTEKPVSRIHNFEKAVLVLNLFSRAGGIFNSEHSIMLFLAKFSLGFTYLSLRNLGSRAKFLVNSGIIKFPEQSLVTDFRLKQQKFKLIHLSLPKAYKQVKFWIVQIC